MRIVYQPTELAAVGRRCSCFSRPGQTRPRRCEARTYTLFDAVKGSLSDRLLVFVVEDQRYCHARRWAYLESLALRIPVEPMASWTRQLDLE